MADGSAITVEVLQQSHPCRRPRPDAGGWEARLAEANRAALARSRQAVRDRLPVLEELLDIHWSEVPRLVPGGAGLVAPHDLGLLFDELFRVQHLPPERLRLFDASGTVSTDVEAEPLEFRMMRPSAASVAALVADRGSVMALAVEEHDRELNGLFEHIDRVAQSTCRLDLVLLGPGASMAVAADSGARLVTPVHGSCLVEGQPGRSHDDLGTMPSLTPVDPPDSCFLPHGWGHRLTGGEQPTLVAVVVLPRLLVKDLLAASAGMGVHHPLLRADVPIALDREIYSYAGSAFDEGGIAPLLEGLTSAEMVARVAAQFAAALGARWSGSATGSLIALTGPLTEAVVVRSPFPGGVLVDETLDNSTAGWCASGRRFRLDLTTAEALAAAMDGASHGWQSITPAGFDSALLRQVLSTGLCEVHT